MSIYAIAKRYDEKSPVSIEKYGQRLIGKTFRQVCEEDDGSEVSIIAESASNYGEEHEDKKRKGGLGEIIEERFFHYKTNGDSRPDFPEAGVELKVTPYKKNKNGTFVAKERLIITMIDYLTVVYETFEESHLWAKARLILLVYYLYKKEIENRLDYRIDYVKLFSPPEQDKRIIRHDFDVIVEKIREGKAHELSESDTLYLGAAPKAATSANRRRQPFSAELAKPRAFAFKSSYMTYVLNTYIVPGKATYEPIIKDGVVDSFEDYISGRIDDYKDCTVEDLCNKFNVDITKRPKNLEAMLAYRILGIKGNHAEEFVKANIAVKIIRIGQNNKIKENMSFPAFKFKELIEETWEDSAFGTYLRETRFLFVVYKYDLEGKLHLKGCQFWNMPYDDLENQVHTVWKKTKQVLSDGLKIKKINGAYTSNFPKASENPVSHVRPHGRDNRDVDELPDGRVYPKQCFWLNNSYILSQLDKRFLK